MVKDRIDLDKFEKHAEKIVSRSFLYLISAILMSIACFITAGLPYGIAGPMALAASVMWYCFFTYSHDYKVKLSLIAYLRKIELEISEFKKI